MTNAKDIKATGANLKCFVVGEPGTGKSIFASTFPTPGFVFDFDNGILSYRGKDFDYEQYEINTKGWINFEKDCTKVLSENKYKTIIIDSASSWTNVAMERAMQLNIKRSEVNGPIWNVHFGLAKNLIEGFARKLISYKGNIVIIAHCESVKDEITGAIHISPALIGGLKRTMPGYFDEVLYSTIQKGEFMLQTVAKGYYKARSRLSGVERLLPDFIPNSYQELMKAVNQNQGGERK